MEVGRGLAVGGEYLSGTRQSTGRRYLTGVRRSAEYGVSSWEDWAALGDRGSEIRWSSCRGGAILCWSTGGCNLWRRFGRRQGYNGWHGVGRWQGVFGRNY